MIVGLILAATVAASEPAPSSTTLAEAAHAIDAGRLDQARLLIGRAIAARAAQPQIDRALADLAFAAGNNSEALARYEHILQAHRDAVLCEKAAIAALRSAQAQRAAQHIDCAIAGAAPSWRAWNAKGALLDYYGDWAEADRAYQHAAQLAPDRPEVLNNRGWSHLLRGDWQGASAFIAQAAQIDPKSTRIANNLELTRVALDASLPERRPGESAEDWAHRLNDAGVAAQLMGDSRKAIAAFTRALEASEIWYARAANNLSRASTQK